VAKKIYSVVLLDPPWQYIDKYYHYKNKLESALKFNTLGVQGIVKHVEQFSPRFLDDAHIYLWTTSAFMGDAFKVIDQCSFNFKTTLPWIKKTKHGKLFFGRGYYYRNSHELCLFCTYKKNRVCNSRSIRTVFEAESKGGTEKPVEIEKLWIENSYVPKTKVLYIYSGKKTFDIKIPVDYFDERRE